MHAAATGLLGVLLLLGYVVPTCDAVTPRQFYSSHAGAGAHTHIPVLHAKAGSVATRGSVADALAHDEGLAGRGEEAHETDEALGDADDDLKETPAEPVSDAPEEEAELHEESNAPEEDAEQYEESEAHAERRAVVAEGEEDDVAGEEEAVSEDEEGSDDPLDIEEADDLPARRSRRRRRMAPLPVANRDICLECKTACPDFCKARFRAEREAVLEERRVAQEKRAEAERARRAARAARVAQGLPASMRGIRDKERAEFDSNVDSLRQQMGAQRAFSQNVPGQVDTSALKKSAKNNAAAYDERRVWRHMRDVAPKAKHEYFETVDILRRATPGLSVAHHLRHHSVDKGGVGSHHPDVSIDPRLQVNLDAVPKNKRGYFKMVNMQNRGAADKIERYMELEQKAHARGWRGPAR